MPGASDPVPRLSSDLHRNTIALGIAAGGTVVAFFGYRAFLPAPFTPDTVALTAFVFWILYATATAVLAQVAFGRIDGDQLAHRLIATAPRRRIDRVEASFAGVGPGLNVTWSILAIAAVGLVVLIPGLVDSLLANVLAFAVVVSSWVVTIYAYAVHYARIQAREPSVQFPGAGDAPVFTDFLYLSSQLATTFSSSDVNILTTRARSVVTGQTIIAYAFTTFIVAMLIGVLFLA